jgi:crotonobetaine/carnitine-CoA ligase
MAACIAVADDIRGEEVKAYVVLQPGYGPDDTPPADLAAFCDERLAYFKVPRYWTYRDDLPRTPSERVIKGALESDPNGTDTPTWDRTGGIWR